MNQYPVGTKVIYEFKLAEVLEVHEDTGFVRSVRCGPFLTSGRNLTVFQNTKANAEVAREFETAYNKLYNLERSRGLNWPVLHGVFVAWFEHVLTGMMTMEDARGKIKALTDEVMTLVQTKSRFGFNLLR